MLWQPAQALTLANRSHGNFQPFPGSKEICRPPLFKRGVRGDFFSDQSGNLRRSAAVLKPETILLSSIHYPPHPATSGQNLKGLQHQYRAPCALCRAPFSFILSTFSYEL
jgi:hypothetical protein